MQMGSAPCRFAEGLGIQTTPFGTSVGFTFKDKDCWRLVLAEGFYAQGQMDAGDRVMCAIKEIKSVLGSECLMVLAAGRVTKVVTERRESQTSDRGSQEGRHEHLFTEQEVTAIVRKAVGK
jgi:hypothetical protein